MYAEISIRFERIEIVTDIEAPAIAERFGAELVQAKNEIELVQGASPEFDHAAFLAGKCFVRYRRRSGSRRSPLPDFYIGAHASVAGLTLLTRDATRYRSYFPGLEIIAP